VRPLEPGFLPRFFLPALALAGACSESKSLTGPNYQVEVAVTRASYVPGDSVFVEITNNEPYDFVWHKCPGIMLQQKSGSGWTEIGNEPCTPGTAFPVKGGQTLVAVFVMPSTAPPGQYRVQARLSVIDNRPPLFWWPSAEFTVNPGIL
jgi:hypothetical protein